MKRIVLALIGFFAACSMCCAQGEDQMVTQPTQVVGRSFNAAGEITKELVSEFIYYEDGKLSRYEIPDYHLHAYFTYTADYLADERVEHAGFEHPFEEGTYYTYEDGRLKTKSQWDSEGYHQDYRYSYFDDGRLEKIELDVDHEGYTQRWLYEYEDGCHTVIESYYSLWSSHWLLFEKTTSQYDDRFNLSSELVEKYNSSGELTSATITHYSYTEDGLLEEWGNQTLDNGTWINTTAQRYVRNAEGTIIEQVDSSWDSETDEWNDTKRITFETSEDGKTYTVSFYKKDGDSWVWDILRRQTILFGDHLKSQQRMLRFMHMEIAYGEGNINQVEFTLESTKAPVYLETNENNESTIRLYPNPGMDLVQVTTPTENAVIRFYDLQGRLVHARRFDFSTTINTDDWAEGVYVWEIWDGFNKASSGKWIKK